MLFLDTGKRHVTLFCTNFSEKGALIPDVEAGNDCDECLNSLSEFFCANVNDPEVRKHLY